MAQVELVVDTINTAEIVGGIEYVLGSRVRARDEERQSLCSQLSSAHWVALLE